MTIQVDWEHLDMKSILNSFLSGDFTCGESDSDVGDASDNDGQQGAFRDSWLRVLGKGGGDLRG